jgi:hypothetical protein
MRDKKVLCGKLKITPHRIEASLFGGKADRFNARRSQKHLASN